MNRITALLTVLFLSLACGSSGYSELAQDYCGVPPDATDCDRCIIDACGTQCMECVDDETCFSCINDDAPDDATCTSNEQAALLLTCVLTADCMNACMGEPPPEPGKPPRIGKGRKRGGKGGKSKSGDGSGEGKAGKGGKSKGGKSH
ncbi:MAG: hypothetical protein KC621_28945 [Myxococcales bacterium]|nr:hypothetical protein [Myxococcales bacterium]